MQAPNAYASGISEVTDTVAPTAAAPDMTVVMPAPQAGSRADIAKDPRPKTVETLKHLVGYIPEVRLGKAIAHWVKSQPPVDPESQLPNPESPQSQ